MRKMLFMNGCLLVSILCLGLEGSLWAGTATYVGIDSITKGEWRTVEATPSFVYGSDGFCVIGDSTSNTTFPAAKPIGTMPSYVVASVSPETITYPWATGYTEGNLNNLLIGSDFESSDLANGQIWWGFVNWTVVDWYIDLQFTDENVHQVAFYANEIVADTDGRITGFEVYDNSGNVAGPGTWGSPLPGNLLATSGSDMTNLYTTPKYAIFHIKGHVQIKVNDVTAGLATVISGIFFDPGTGAVDPTPKNGQPNVAIDTDLFWGVADVNEPTFEVIFNGGDAQDVGTSMTFDPGLLVNDTEYTWQVNTNEPNQVPGGAPTTYVGPVWRFTTIPLLPVITQDPEDVWVQAGETAVFTVAAEVIGDPDQVLTFQWYFTPDPNETPYQPLAGATATEDVLVIENVAAENLGSYFCEVTGDAGSVNSAAALLQQIILLGHWPLDGDPKDISGFDKDGIARGGVPSFETGRIGQAANFNGNSLFEIPDPAHFDQANTAITVYCWIKTPNTVGDWNPYVAKDGDSAGWALRKQSTNDVGTFTLQGTTGPADPYTGVSVFNDQWHQMVGTWDGKVRRIYLDGVVIFVAGDDTGPIAFTAAPVSIGGRMDAVGTPSSGSYFPSLIDDVRIYKGALSEFHIARLYTDATGLEICSTPQIGDLSGPIGVPDCLVNLWDLSVLAEYWLMDTNFDPDK